MVWDLVVDDESHNFGNCFDISEFKSPQTSLIVLHLPVCPESHTTVRIPSLLGLIVRRHRQVPTDPLSIDLDPIAPAGLDM
jgi:hypothetical protein